MAAHVAAGTDEQRILPWHELILHARAYRKRQRLSQGDVAERAGLSRAAVSGLERLAINPALSTVALYLDALGFWLDGFVVNDPRGRDLDGTTVIVGPGAAATGHQPVPACLTGAPLPGHTGLVIGECGTPRGRTR